MERHQGHLGERLGRAARPGRGRSTSQQDELNLRRRLPEAGHRVRGLYPRALFRARPQAAPDGGAPLGRGSPAPPAWRARLQEALRGLQGGGRTYRGAHGDTGQDGQGLDVGLGDRGPQCDPPDQEDDLRADDEAARHPASDRGDPRLGLRGQASPLSPPRPGNAGVRVHAPAQAAAGWEPAGAHRASQPDPGSQPVRLRGVLRRLGQGTGLHDHGLRQAPAQSDP